MKYQTLNENEIRLITLLPTNQPDETVRCTIEHFVLEDLYHTEEYKAHVANDFLDSDVRSSWIELSHRERGESLGDDWVDVSLMVDDATKHLPLPRYTWGDYLALSYTWGGSNVMREIVANGKPVLVTENLEEGLRVLRGKQYIRDGWKLWVDALCINQQDIIERATQVKNMRKIYSRAWTPLIWLGTAVDDSEAAIDLIKTLSTMYPMRSAITHLTMTLKQNPKAFGEGSWRALYQFIIRRYWRRAWILQEASLGRSDMPMLCGEQTIPWIDVHRTFWLLNKSDEVINTYIANELEQAGLEFDTQIWNNMFVVGEIEKLQSEQLDGQTVNLYRVMSLSRNVFTTDPRDKIYGLLAMMENELTSRIVPDYTAPVSDVYAGFARLTIEATNSLELLRHTSPYGTQDLPSWVPDWTAEHMLSSLTLSNTLHATSGTSQAMVDYLPEGRISVTGFVVDAFDGFGCLYQEVPSGRGWPADTVVQPSHSANPYHNEAGVREAIWRTMVADRDIYVEPLKEDYSSLLATPVIFEAGPALSETDPLKYVAGSNILDWSAQFLRGNVEFRVCGKRLGDYLPSSLDEVRGQVDPVVLRDVLVARDRINVRRRMMSTQKGYIGMALQEVRMDDVIAVLLGCSMPMVLRPVDDDAHEYSVVGECYIHGIMGGEAMHWVDNGQCKMQEFTIR